ncbi:MAG TPA: hypothetical protein GX736_02435 [Mogibacterium sp.]|nr:hypothetical protein [Mogibacterium sp.]
MAKSGRKVSIISRENDYKSLDIRLIEKELVKRGIEVETLTRRLTKDISLRNLGYLGHIARQIKSIAGSKVVLIDTYCIPISMLPVSKKTTVIQMWHALGAIKKFGWQTVGKKNGTRKEIAGLMRMHRGYDEVLASSDVTAKFFCEAFDCTEDKIVKIGLPRIDYILQKNTEVEESIYKQYPVLKKKKNILYAPTFRGGKAVDTESLTGAVDFSKYNLVVKLHPIDKLRTEKIDKPGIIYDDIYDTYDMLKVADIIISDYSAFVIEASLAQKPLYLYTYDEEDYRETTGLNVNLSEEAIGKYSFSKAKDLLKEIEKDYDYEALAEFRNKYIDIDTNNCTKQLADHIEEILDS